MRIMIITRMIILNANNYCEWLDRPQMESWVVNLIYNRASHHTPVGIRMIRKNASSLNTSSPIHVIYCTHHLLHLMSHTSSERKESIINTLGWMLMVVRLTWRTLPASNQNIILFLNSIVTQTHNTQHTTHNTQHTIRIHVTITH